MMKQLVKGDRRGKSRYNCVLGTVSEIQLYIPKATLLEIMLYLTPECESYNRIPLPVEVLFHMWEQLGIDHLEHRVATSSVTAEMEG